MLVPTSYPREGLWSDRAKASHLVWTGLSLGTPNLIRVNMVKCNAYSRTLQLEPEISLHVRHSTQGYESYTQA